MNVVCILSDQHNPSFTGCYGGITRTPNIDSLASSGAIFTNAYTNCPICVPTRASMITGRYVHEIGNWDNTVPYDGRIPGWGHYFQKNGICLTTVGSLDFKEDVDHGIEDERIPVHRFGLDVVSLFRDPPMTPRVKMHLNNHWIVNPRDPNVPTWQSDPNIDPDDPYIPTETEVTEEAINWLENKRPDNRPWVLNINYSKPHPAWQPLPDLFEYYKKQIKELPEKYFQPFEQLNEVEQAQSIHTCGFLGPDKDVYTAHAGYHATVEEADSEIGRVLSTLENLGIKDEVLIVYASDHGEMARAHGAWSKFSLYEDSIRIPMIIAGPGIPKNIAVSQPVSLIDLFPTINDALGRSSANFARGSSLMNLARGEKDPERNVVFTESHCNGRIAGSFAIRRGDWKLIAYVGYDPMLFNLKDDPDEMHNLLIEDKKSDNAQNQLQELYVILYSFCSPEGVDMAARRDQLHLRQELARTGRLQEELYKRGFERNETRLILQEQFRNPKGLHSNQS